jgi:pilus assembly protein Flp/PilA
MGYQPLAQFLLKGRAMRQFTQRVVNFLKREDGPTAVEYAVMLALIIVVCITAITTLGSNANKTFNTVANAVGNAS